MSPFAILLTCLFFFPGFAVSKGKSGISAPNCLSSWELVCMLLFTLCILSYYLICWHHIQASNSLGQSPCTIAAYLLSTCAEPEGCQYYYLPASTNLVDSSLLQRLPFLP